jgi:ABC-type spermidine/putrescine transport system permease subunit II
MRLSRRSRILLRIAVAVGLAFIYVPLIVIAIYAFNSSKILE